MKEKREAGVVSWLVWSTVLPLLCPPPLPSTCHAIRKMLAVMLHGPARAGGLHLALLIQGAFGRT